MKEFTILAIDDEPAILNCLRRELKREPFHVLTATSGLEGLEILKELELKRELPAVVVSDYRMPGMDGVEFLERVKQRYPDIQRILLTAYASPSVLEDAINRCEIYRFLNKPWDHNMMCSMLLGATQQYALLQKNHLLVRERNLQNERLRELNEGLERLVEQRTHQLHHAKEEISTTFDAIGAPVMLIQADHEVVRGNGAIARHAQLRAEELPGHKCYNLLRGADTPCENCPLPQARREGVMATGRLNLPRRQVIFEASVYPVHSASQETSRFVCLYHDITEEEKNRDKLIQVQKMAALGHLSGAVAHEINNPLGGILAFAQILKRDAPENSESYLFLNHIEDAAVRCRDIVRKLLSYARSSPSEERQVTTLGSLVRKALDLNQHMLSLANVEIRWQEADGAGEAPVLLNAVDIQGLYINLIQNAHDAMEGKGGSLTISLRMDTELSPPVVVSQVSDTGSGIKPENLTRIFDPFFTTKEVGRGTGLGLSLAFQSVQSNGGTIEVDSTEGEGTTFTIAFPVVWDVKAEG